jgi:hypothetical protein
MLPEMEMIVGQNAKGKSEGREYGYLPLAGGLFGLLLASCCIVCSQKFAGSAVLLA